VTPTRTLALAIVFALSTAPAALAQSVITQSPDPAHTILCEAFQSETDFRSHTRLTSGNRLELLEDGVQSLPARLAMIATATSQIMVQTMLWNYDTAGKLYADALIARARAGVEVRAVVDGLLADPRIYHRLRDGGVKVVRYNPFGLGFVTNRRTGRMHEKVLCVDVDRAIAGGMNLANDYLLGGPQFPDRYHDVDLHIEGFGAVEVARRFLEIYTSLEPTDAPAHVLLASLAARQQSPPARGPVRDGTARSICNEPDLGNEFITDYYVRVLGEAKQQVVWHSNNPMPVDPLLQAAKDAARRGVRVVIVTNSRKAFLAKNGSLVGWIQDLIVRKIARDRLKNTGIQIYEMDRPIHSKTLTIDGVMASIGSYNFSFSSVDKNIEQAIVTYDPAIVRKVEEMFERDLATATRVQ
jgi:cardiolipin synthase